MSQKNRVGLMYVLIWSQSNQRFKQKIKLFAKKEKKKLGKN